MSNPTAPAPGADPQSPPSDPDGTPPENPSGKTPPDAGSDADTASGGAPQPS